MEKKIIQQILNDIYSVFLKYMELEKASEKELIKFKDELDICINNRIGEVNRNDISEAKEYLFNYKESYIKQFKDKYNLF